MDTRPIQPKRPFGVYAIIALLLLRVLSIFVDVERVRLGLTPLILPDLDNSLSVVVVIAITIAAILAVSIGLFLLKRWAWIGVMILIGLNLLYGIVHYLNGGQPFVSWRSSFYGVNEAETDWEQVFVQVYENDQGELEPRWVAYALHDFKGDDLSTN